MICIHSNQEATMTLELFDQIPSREVALKILERAKEIKRTQIFPSLDHLEVFTLFHENSTRTKLSFHKVLLKSRAKYQDFETSSSSLSKGEDLEDTLLTLKALGMDLLIIRYSDQASLVEVLRKVDHLKLKVISAGLGVESHPTQTLLDLMTMEEHLKRLDGISIGVCGDLRHSRVYASLKHASSFFDIKLNLLAPSELLPKSTLIHEKVMSAKSELYEESDVLIFLRIQKERHLHHLSEEEISSYKQNYSLTLNDSELLAQNHKFILHPGPVNKDIEIAKEVLTHPLADHILIQKQVENGVYTRAALIEHLFYETLS